jgi:D-arabinose 1-dehydrogenase-like Zn-dependent alcohol dehydrogenase
LLHQSGRAFPGTQFPRVPGHEIVGIVDAVGADVPDPWNARPRRMIE